MKYFSWHHYLMANFLGFAVLLMCLQAFASGENGELDLLKTRRAAMAQDFARPIADCVQRLDNENLVFHGCADWHSAVHGVWALTAYTWATGDQQYRSLIDKTLRPSLLIHDQKYLAENPKFEMPYGRSWFLRLAIDYKRAFKDDRLDAIADDAAKSLMVFYSAKPPDPKSIGYHNATWALINLYDYGEATGRNDITDFVKAKVRENYLKESHCNVQGLEVSSGEFMAVCTDWAWLVARTEPKEEFTKWVENFLPVDRSYAPVGQPVSIHQTALNFSRAWGFWEIYRKSGDPRFLQAYIEHLNAGYSNKDAWNGNYSRYGHWLPQFGMMAVMVTYYDWPDAAK